MMQPMRLLLQYKWWVALAMLVIVGAAGLLAWWWVKGSRISLPEEVARIDGQPIRREVFLQHVRLARASYFPAEAAASLPEEVLYTAVLEDLIAYYILLAEARKASITVSEKEVQGAMASLQHQHPQRYIALLRALENDEGQLRELLRRDLLIRRYLDEVFKDDPIVVTDEEVAAVYDLLRQKQGGNQLPPLETVRETIRETLRQEKVQERVRQLVARLQRNHTIEVLWPAGTSSPATAS